MILGGYGGTGSVFCRYLLSETDLHVVIAGRNPEKALALADRLKLDFPKERISVCQTDASDKESLLKSFRNIDFVLVAATTAVWSEQIARAALEANIDYLDIYFQQNVYPKLQFLSDQIKKAGRCFITQAGFHPGLPAAFIRKGALYFDRYDKAIIAFTMNARIEDPDSILELVDSVSDYQPEFYQNGRWIKGTYKDALQVDYGKRFGTKMSMPIDMVEIKSLPGLLGLKETGVFTTGFNWFTDYVLFPLMMISNKIKKGVLRHFWARLFLFGMNTFSRSEEGVVFLLLADGIKDEHHRKLEIFSEHDRAYDFTIIPVIACLKQYLEGTIRKPGLWMMGHLVDPDQLLSDMQAMGVNIRSIIND